MDLNFLCVSYNVIGWMVIIKFSLNIYIFLKIKNFISYNINFFKEHMLFLQKFKNIQVQKRINEFLQKYYLQYFD